MKLNVKYMIAAFALLGLVGCDKNFEEFETSGEEVLLPLNFLRSCRRLCRDRLN